MIIIGATLLGIFLFECISSIGSGRGMLYYVIQALIALRTVIHLVIELALEGTKIFIDSFPTALDKHRKEVGA